MLNLKKPCSVQIGSSKDLKYLVDKIKKLICFKEQKSWIMRGKCGELTIEIEAFFCTD
jgi:hypothetical protein